MAMTERIITPTGRGFLLLDSHPAGCERSVAAMRAQVPAGSPASAEPIRQAPAAEPIKQAHAAEPIMRAPSGRPVVLVIGASAGYGLATTIAGLARHGMNGVGIGFERPPG